MIKKQNQARFNHQYHEDLNHEFPILWTWQVTKKPINIITFLWNRQDQNQKYLLLVACLFSGRVLGSIKSTVAMSHT